MPQRVQAAGFAAVPYALMDSARDPFVIAVFACLHRHGWNSVQGCWVSVQTIVTETGAGWHSVRRALRWLKEQRWVEAMERPGYTTSYLVRIDTPYGSATPHESGRGDPSRIREGTPHRSGRGPLTDLEGKQEPKNKNSRTRLETSSPYPFSEGGKAGAAGAAPTDRGEGSGRGERKKRFKPQGDDVPLLLQPVAVDVLEFWESKQGAKSEAAWKRLMAELELIANDPAGGIAVVKAQLDTGIQSGKWQSITHANWVKYRGETHATRNGSRLAHGGYGSKAQQNAAEAKRLLDQWDQDGGVFASAASRAQTQAALPQEVYPWS